MRKETVDLREKLFALQTNGGTTTTTTTTALSWTMLSLVRAFLYTFYSRYEISFTYLLTWLFIILCLSVCNNRRIKEPSNLGDAPLNSIYPPLLT